MTWPPEGIEPYYKEPSVLLYQGDAREVLKYIPDKSVQVCMTSPPYWGLRDYGIEPLVWGGDPGHEHEWRTTTFEKKQGTAGSGLTNKGASQMKANRFVVETGFCPCGAWRGSLGLELSPEMYVEHLVEIFREVRRVLRDDGTVWLNMGDCYGGSGGAHTLDHANPGLSRSAERAGVPHYSADGSRGLDKHSVGFKAKDLIEISSMVSEALRQDGWWRRARIIWFKPNPMPESVTDRPTVSHEYIFLLSKKANYYYDQEAIREAHDDPSDVYRRLSKDGQYNHKKSQRGWMDGSEERASRAMGRGRNKRTVWGIATQAFSDAHFAVFPEALCEPPILAGSSPKACGECGAPWERVVEKSYVNPGNRSTNGPRSVENGEHTAGFPIRLEASTSTIGWQPTCSHQDDTGHSVVLDPFCGTGTVGLVAKKLGRRFIGVDLKAEYLDMAKRRIVAMPAPMKLEI